MENDHIVCRVQPFMYKQEVSVYQNGECVKNVRCTLSDFQDVVLALADQYDIHKVDLAGSSLFVSKVKKDLEKRNLEMYSNRKLEVFLH